MRYLYFNNKVYRVLQSFSCKPNTTKCKRKKVSILTLVSRGKTQHHASKFSMTLSTNKRTFTRWTKGNTWSFSRSCNPCKWRVKRIRFPKKRYQCTWENWCVYWLEEFERKTLLELYHSVQQPERPALHAKLLVIFIRLGPAFLEVVQQKL